MQAMLVLEDGSQYECFSFGHEAPSAGEVVFNTGMAGYPEALTDPSYRGQILVLTFPLIGNYGVPENSADGLLKKFESEHIQVAGLVVSDYSRVHNHWDSKLSLAEWLAKERVPAVCGVDTRALTKKLREQGVMLGQINFGKKIEFVDPDKQNLAAMVSCKQEIIYGNGQRRVLLLDCGVKHSIIRSLLKRGLSVKRVPWNHDISKESYDALLISNGPGSPETCTETVRQIRAALARKKPVMGICMGNLLLAMAAGASTRKLKYGHRGQNQPCIDLESGRCHITSQNHGFEVITKTLPAGWKPWFVNANDRSNEGIMHESGLFLSVQFHPEAAPGPADTEFLFDKLVGMIK